MPFAFYDRDTSSWRTCQPSLFSESLPEQSATWPRSGMTRSGNAFERPTSGRHIGESGASSLLKTPTAQLAINGGSQHPEKRKAGGHGPTLADEVEHLLPNRSNPDSKHHAGTTLTDAVTLLPTPRASDGTKGGPNQRGSSGDLMLPSAVVHLLPTPTVGNAMGGNKTRSGSGSNELLLPGLAVSIGETTNPPSADGKPPSDDPHQSQLSRDATDNVFRLF